MKKLFVPYNIALLAKQKGFDEECLAAIYPDGELIEQLFGKLRRSKNEEMVIAAPLYQQIVDWFREKYGILLLPACPIPPEAVKIKPELIIRGMYNIYLYNINWNPRIPSIGVFSNDWYEAYNKAFEEAFKLI